MSASLGFHSTIFKLKEELDNISNFTHIGSEFFQGANLIITDDGSTDNTLLILEEYSKINPLVFDFLATNYLYK